MFEPASSNALSTSSQLHLVLRAVLAIRRPLINEPTRPSPRPHMLFPPAHGGGCNPHASSPLIEIEPWDRDQTISWDVRSSMVPELTSLGHILTPPGQVKVKMIAI